MAEALGIGVAAYKLLAFVISSSMTSVAGCLFAYYRGFVSIEAFDLFLSIQYVAMIIIGGMGSLLGALLGAAFVTVFPYAIESLLRLLPNAQKLAGDIFAVNYACLRRGDDSVFGVGAARAGRHLAAAAELLLALAVQIAAARGGAQMSEPLLQVEKIEVVYKRVITAVQGVTLSVRHKQIVALLGTNGAGKTTTLRAISGFLGIDDARVTEGSYHLPRRAHRKSAAARDRRPRHRAGPRAREGISQSHRRREPRRAGAARGQCRGAAGGCRSRSFTSFRASPNCVRASAGCCRAASGRCWRSPAR